MFLVNKLFKRFDKQEGDEKYTYLFKNRLVLWLTCVAGGFIVGLAGVYFNSPVYEAYVNIPISNIDSAIAASQLSENVTSKPTVAGWKQKQLYALTSLVLVSQLVDSLPLHTEAFKSTGPFRRQKVYGPKSPVAITVIKCNLISGPRYTLKIINESSFILQDGQKSTSHLSGQLINEPGIQLRIDIKQTAFKFPQKLTLKIYGRREAADDVLNGLRARPANSDTSSLALTYRDDDAVKASDVLRKAYSLYLQNYLSNSREDLKVLLSIDKQISGLKAELAAYTENIIDSTQVKPGADTAKTIMVTGAVNRQQAQKQLSILTALKPYLQKPVSNFVLLPNSYGLQDDSLNSLIAQINSSQLKKQILLKNEPGTLPQVKEIENRLIALRQLITDRIKTTQAFYTKFTGIKKTFVAQQSSEQLYRRQDAIGHSAKIRLYLYLLEERDRLITYQNAIQGLKNIALTSNITITKVNDGLIISLILGLAVGFVLPLLLIRVKKHKA